MATPQPTAPFAQPPPTLPNMPDVSDTLSRYLRTFSLWCVQGLASKLNTNSAIPGLQLQATDQPVPNNPVYELGVTSAGAATLAPVTLGTGTVGTPVPVGTGQYLPLNGGGTVDGSLTVNGIANVSNTLYVFQAAGTIPQSGGGSFMVQAAGGGNEAFITFHRPGQFATNFGLGADGRFHYGGWSAGAVSYQFWTSADFAHPMAAIEELQARVEALTARLNQLEGR